MELSRDEKVFLKELIGSELKKFKETGHVVQELIAVLAAEEKYEHFLEQLYKKFGGKTSDGHEL